MAAILRPRPQAPGDMPADAPDSMNGAMRGRVRGLPTAGVGSEEDVLLCEGDMGVMPST
jgi:hypothetical protein